MKQLAVPAFRQHLPSEFSSQFRKGCRAWAQDLDSSAIPFFEQGVGLFAHFVGEASGFFFAIPDQSEIDQSGEGRIVEGPPKLNLFLVEPKEVVILCPQNAVVIRIEGLDHYLSRGLPSSRPSGHLGEKLEGPLA